MQQPPQPPGAAKRLTASEVEAFVEANLGLATLHTKNECGRDMECLLMKLLAHRFHRTTIHWQRFLLHEYLTHAAHALRGGMAPARTQLKCVLAADGDDPTTQGRWFWNSVDVSPPLRRPVAGLHIHILEIWVESPVRRGRLCMGLLLREGSRTTVVPLEPLTDSLLRSLQPHVWYEIYGIPPDAVQFVPRPVDFYTFMLWLHVALVHRMTTAAGGAMAAVDVVGTLAREPTTEHGSGLLELHLVDAILSPSGYEAQVDAFLERTVEESSHHWMPLPYTNATHL